jgi:integrase-like protein
MPTVNYYLKKPDGRPSRSLIFLQFKYKGRKLVYAFGQKINPLDWSKDKQRVRSNHETILNGLYALNDLLDELEKTCLKYYQEELLKGIPEVAVLKFRLDTFTRCRKGLDANPTFYPLFERFIAGEIKNKGKDKSRNTLKNYSTTRGHLDQFAISRRYHLNFENINLDFCDRYTAFLRDELQLKPGSIAKDISVIKTVMSEAVDQGHTSNIQWRHKKFRYPIYFLTIVIANLMVIT